MPLQIASTMALSVVEMSATLALVIVVVRRQQLEWQTEKVLDLPTIISSHFRLTLQCTWKV